MALVVLLGACTSPAPRPAASPVDTVEVAARAAHSATVLGDGTVLVAGGCVIDGCGTASPAAFALTSSTATEVGAMHDARDAHTATLLPTVGVLVTGGFSGEGVPPLSSRRGVRHRDGLVVGGRSAGDGTRGPRSHWLGSDRVLVAGGWLRSRTYTGVTEIFDPASGSFPGPQLPVAADGLEAVALADGRVLVTGGQSAPGVATDQAVVVAADGTRLDVVGPLGTARFKHTMVALADGRVLVIGGTSDDVALLTSTEVFDPASGSFSPGPELRWALQAGGRRDAPPRRPGPRAHRVLTVRPR